MVNHAETLVMNMSAVDFDTAGVPRPWYIDPEFASPVKVPASLAGVRAAVFSGAETIPERVARTLSACRLARTADLSWAVDLLDGRRTIGRDDLGSVSDMYMSSPSPGGYEASVVRAAVSCPSMHVPAGVSPDVDEAVGILVPVLRSSFEMTSRFSAALSLYLYRMEAERLGRGGKAGS